MRYLCVFKAFRPELPSVGKHSDDPDRRIRRVADPTRHRCDSANVLSNVDIRLYGCTHLAYWQTNQRRSGAVSA
jgi:hypothetical protein